jgi:hypothetical protein
MWHFQITKGAFRQFLHYFTMLNCFFIIYKKDYNYEILKDLGHLPINYCAFPKQEAS